MVNFLSSNHPTEETITNNKKYLPLLVLIIIVIALLLSALFYLGRNNINFNSESELSKGIRSQVTRNDEYFDKATVDEKLKSLNDSKKSKEERFQVLNDIFFYFSYAYSRSHNPDIRNFVNKNFITYANENFSELQANEDTVNTFNIPCADPTCGQEIDPGLKDVMDFLNKSTIEERLKNRFINNLTLAGYKDSGERDEIEFGFQLTYRQLIQADNPTASDAAQMLKTYAFEKYRMDLAL